MKILTLAFIILFVGLSASGQNNLLTGTYRNSQGSEIIVGDFSGGLGIMVPGNTKFVALIKMADGWYANPYLGIMCMADENNNLLFGFSSSGTTDLYVRYDEKKEKAKAAFERGKKYASQGKYCDAAEQFEQAYHYEENSGNSDPADLRFLSDNAGINYSSCGNPDKTIEWTKMTISYLEKELENNAGSDVQYSLAGCYLRLAQVYAGNAETRGNLELALKFSEKGIELVNEFPDSKQKHYMRAQLNLELGMLYGNGKNDYQTAIQYYEEAKKDAEELDGEQHDAMYGYIMSGQSMLYSLMGDMQKSIGCSLQLVGFLRNHKSDMSYLCSSLTSLASSYSKIGDFINSKKYIEEAIQISNSLGNSDENEDMRHSLLNEKANILLNENKLDEAEQLYVEVFNYFKNSKTYVKSVNMKGALYGLYKISMIHKDYAYCHNLIVEGMKLGAGYTPGKETEVGDLSSLAGIYLLMNNPEKAATFLEPAIAIQEALVKSLPKEKLRSYLNERYYNYQMLCQSYIMSGKAKEALEVVEIGTGKGLLGDICASDNSYVDIDKYTAGLPDTKLICRFPYLNNQTGSIGTLLISNNGVTCRETKVDSIMQEITSSLSGKIAHFSTDSVTRGFKSIKIKNQTTSDGKVSGEKGNTQNIDLGTVIHFYNSLLSNTSPARGFTKAVIPGKSVTSDELSDFEFLSHSLYNLFFGEISSSLHGKKELVIIPDGVLAFLPFETFINPEGKMLGELFTVTYAQSLAISNEINKRKYASTGKILAMGGAVYKPKTVQPENITYSADESLRIVNKMTEAVEKDADLTSVYDTYIAPLGWDPIPGTLSEVNNIAVVAPQVTKIIQGENLNKNNLFNINTSGELARYRILHFATHGIVVWSVPELSALVLSSSNNSKTSSYLTLKEITKLKISAQLVTLSACETGLGFAFMGEGVMGLPQAFIRAGARNVIASLWSVDDAATTRFMTELYKKIITGNIPVGKALAITKQEFYAGKYGKKYQSPYYWAPFVCYGSASDHYIQTGEPQQQIQFTNTHYTLPEFLPSADDVYKSASANFNSGKFDEAISDYTRSIALRPDYDGYYGRAIAYLRKGDYINASKDLSNSIRLKPDQVECLKKRAYVYEQEKKPEAAILDYNKIIALQPDSSINYLNKGKDLVQLRKFSEAVICLKRATDLESNNPFGHYLLAYSHQRNGDTVAALKEYTKVIQIDSTLPDPYFYRAFLIFKTRGLNASRSDFNTVIAREESSGRLLYKPYVLQCMGHPEEALNLSRILARNKNSANSYYDLACIYSLQKDTKNAVMALSTAIDKGYSEFDSILEDQDFINIRGAGEFKELLAKHGIKQK